MSFLLTTSTTFRVLFCFSTGLRSKERSKRMIKTVFGRYKVGWSPKEVHLCQIVDLKSWKMNFIYHISTTILIFESYMLPTIRSTRVFHISAFTKYVVWYFFCCEVWSLTFVLTALVITWCGWILYYYMNTLYCTHPVLYEVQPGGMWRYMNVISQSGIHWISYVT